MILRKVHILFLLSVRWLAERADVPNDLFDLSFFFFFILFVVTFLVTHSSG